MFLHKKVEIGYRQTTYHPLGFTPWSDTLLCSEYHCYDQLQKLLLFAVSVIRTSKESASCNDSMCIIFVRHDCNITTDILSNDSSTYSSIY